MSPPTRNTRTTPSSSSSTGSPTTRCWSPCRADTGWPGAAACDWPTSPKSPWITASRRIETTLLAACARSGFQPRVEYEVAGWTAKLGLVAAGLGITLIPSLAARAARPDLTLVPLHPDDTPVRHVHTATRRGHRPAPAVTAFLPLLRAATAE
ncbi:LysR substrate-binding domain-containing protein [Kitasatospora sp. NPDC004615]|uniref:LysR substrate-binding domain-containing protein n=1 Tax=Kitasatospora sp. NPDC004615 TaxID=3364017 RepID=UPI0036C9C04A